VVKVKPRKNERLRLLEVLSKRAAHLEWPLQNKTMDALLREGLVEKAEQYKAGWGAGLHTVAVLRINASGRQLLAEMTG